MLPAARTRYPAPYLGGGLRRILANRYWHPYSKRRGPSWMLNMGGKPAPLTPPGLAAACGETNRHL